MPNIVGNDLLDVVVAKLIARLQCPVGMLLQHLWLFVGVYYHNQGLNKRVVFGVVEPGSLIQVAMIEIKSFGLGHLLD